ncbi:F-box only protein 5 [Ascaphus truei]|uniref:F-box only protein 5 n=1 Tax=Ascaphus truei TaxID=8439 RepID=UPI003F5A3F8B
MKCGFKSSPSKLSPTKLNTVKLEANLLKYEQEPCKGCAKSGEGQPSESSLNTLAQKHVNVLTEDRPVYNKENLLQRLGESEANDVECSGLQDSGYSSILHSDSPDQEEDSIVSGEPVCDTPQQLSKQNQRHFQAPSTNLLPVLRFEEVVCSTLKKTAKRSPKVDWDVVDEVVSQGCFGLENLIGKSMGLERLDILGELFQRDFKHLLTKILRHLSEIDLINVVSVSTTWRKILQRDRWAYHIYNTAPKELGDNEAKLTVHAATRDVPLCRVPLSTVQKVASASCSIVKKKLSKQNNKIGGASRSRHTEFNEVAQTLKNDQSLKVCNRCGSPAKYDSYLHRATCTRESCMLDFCTLCLCDYHFSKNCLATSKPQGQRYLSEPLPGSKKSKHNLRRL